jgi:hypothetical protein
LDTFRSGAVAAPQILCGRSGGLVPRILVYGTVIRRGRAPKDFARSERWLHPKTDSTRREQLHRKDSAQSEKWSRANDSARREHSARSERSSYSIGAVIAPQRFHSAGAPCSVGAVVAPQGVRVAVLTSKGLTFQAVVHRRPCCKVGVKCSRARRVDPQ